MKITICASLDFSSEIGQIAEELTKRSHEVLLPATTEKILQGLVLVEDIKSEKETGKGSERAIKNNAIINHYQKIVSSDAVLILNFIKKDIAGYIGGSAFMEMAFAFVNNKKIFLWDVIPEISYTDEIKAMQPVLINKDINNIK